MAAARPVWRRRLRAPTVIPVIGAVHLRAGILLAIDAVLWLVDPGRGPELDAEEISRA